MLLPSKMTRAGHYRRVSKVQGDPNLEGSCPLCFCCSTKLATAHRSTGDEPPIQQPSGNLQRLASQVSEKPQPATQAKRPKFEAQAEPKPKPQAKPAQYSKTSQEEGLKSSDNATDPKFAGDYHYGMGSLVRLEGGLSRPVRCGVSLEHAADKIAEGSLLLCFARKGKKVAFDASFVKQVYSDESAIEKLRTDGRMFGDLMYLENRWLLIECEGVRDLITLELHDSDHMKAFGKALKKAAEDQRATQPAEDPKIQERLEDLMYGEPEGEATPGDPRSKQWVDTTVHLVSYGIARKAQVYLDYQLGALHVRRKGMMRTMPLRHQVETAVEVAKLQYWIKKGSNIKISDWNLCVGMSTTSLYSGAAIFEFETEEKRNWFLETLQDVIALGIESEYESGCEVRDSSNDLKQVVDFCRKQE